MLFLPDIRVVLTYLEYEVICQMYSLTGNLFFIYYRIDDVYICVQFLRNIKTDSRGAKT